MSDIESRSAIRPVLQFFASPLGVAIGWILGLLGFIWGIYSYYAGQKRPELTYYVDPARAAIVTPGRVTSLKVSFKDAVISGGVSAAQIVFWNAGEQPIEMNDILEPVTVSLGKQNRILEANVRKVSRDLIKLTVDDTKAPEGSVQLNWKLLEKEDGGVIQLIYEGLPDANVHISGTIKGQKTLGRVLVKPNMYNVGAWCVSILVSLACSVSIALDIRRKVGRKTRIAAFVSAITMLIVAVFGVWIILALISTPTIPISF